MNIVRLLRQGSMPYLYTALTLGTASGLLLTFLVQMIHRAITGAPPDPVRFIGYYMLIWLAYLVCTTISTLATSGMAHKSLYQLRLWVTDHILKVSYRSTEGRTSEYFPVLTEDLQTISNTIYRVPQISTAIATIIGCVGYMFYLSWSLTLMILFALVIIYITMTTLGRWAQQNARLARTQYDKIYHFFEDLLYGLKELKLNPVLRDHYRQTLFPPLIREHQRLKLRENILFNFSIRSIEILFFPALGVLVYTIFVYGLTTPAAFTGVLTVLLFMLSPMASAANFVSEYKAMQVSLQRVNALEDHVISNVEWDFEQEPIPVPGEENSRMTAADGSGKSPEKVATEEDGLNSDRSGSGLTEVSGRPSAAASASVPILQLDDIRLSYTRDNGETNFVLGPLSLEIPANRITFIVGDNGSGKSTLAKVVTGLYAPDQGSIRYRGIRIKPQYLEDYRARFSSVFSDFHLFRELPDGAYNLDALPHWLEVTGLSKQVQLQGNILQHRRLSQGQRERLALAIACSYESEIILLDEIASNQDADFKVKIYHEILPALREEGRTVIAISHDDRFFHMADNLIHFRDGKIINTTA